MKHLKPYNESIRDKMTGKELSEEDKYAYEQFDKIKFIDDKFSSIKKINNVYYSISYLHSILITYCDPKTYKGNEEIGYQQYHIVKIKKDWTIYTNTSGTNRDYKNENYIINTDNFNTILKKVIEECHKDIGSHIDIIKEEIKEKKSILSRLKYIKNLRETL